MVVLAAITVGHRMGYKRALVTYIDMIGFRSLVARSREDASEVSQIASALRSLKDELKFHPSETDYFKKKGHILQSSSFSDLVVRCRETPSDDENRIVMEVTRELITLAALQAKLLEGAVLIRGGVCIGDMHVEPDIVFGPGLVRAYELEAHLAVFPRVVIDGDLATFLKLWEASQPADADVGPRDEFFYWEDFVRSSDDGIYFLDYLVGHFLNPWRFAASEGVFGFEITEEDSCWETLSRHGAAIREMLGSESGTERVRQKHLWLAVYHNSVVERLQSCLPAINLRHPPRYDVRNRLESERIDLSLIKG